MMKFRKSVGGLSDGLFESVSGSGGGDGDGGGK